MFNTQDKLINKIFTCGQCHSLAFALCDLIGGDIVVATKMSEGEIYPTHIAVYYDGKIIDIEGAHVVEDFVDKWGSDYQKITKQEFKDDWEEGFPLLVENSQFCIDVAKLLMSDIQGGRIMPINHKKTLRELTSSVVKFENAMDIIMKKPSTPQRGKEVAIALNFLTMANQAAMRFSLNYSWGKIKKLYNV